MREVKNAAADRADVVVELREATRMRLQMLAAELAPVFAEVPADIDSFDFSVSSGLQPRLWIDAVSHVAMGRDHRTYRFVKDTRNGRAVLAESPKVDVVADQVTRYIAERIVEREQMLVADASEAEIQADAAPRQTEPLRIAEPRSYWRGILSGAWAFITGVGFGLAIAIALLWDRLTGVQ